MNVAVAVPPPATGLTILRGSQRLRLELRHAGVADIDVRYECVGPSDAPVIVILGGISAHRQLISSSDSARRGWLEDLIGAGRALDPARSRLLSVDWIGSDGQLDCPIDTADQAAALASLLRELRIQRVAAVVGYSYGALVALQLAAAHKTRIDRLVVVSGAHRPHPYASAWRALQRRAVTLGQLQCGDAHGLALARQFAMLSYRTPEEFAERFDAEPRLVNGRVRVCAEDYLDAAGAQFVARMPTTAWVRLSESIDLHRVDPGQITLPTTVIAVEGDRLVPLSDMVGLVERLGGPTTLRVLRSAYGHDAFLKENDRIDALLHSALNPQGDTV